MQTQPISQETVERLTDLIYVVLDCILDKPDYAKVVFANASRGPTFTVTVHPSDLGHAIGKSGRNAGAIRVLVKSAARKAGSSAYVLVHDDNKEANGAKVSD